MGETNAAFGKRSQTVSRISPGRVEAGTRVLNVVFLTGWHNFGRPYGLHSVCICLNNAI
jgi:hypothetical protein